MFQHLICIISIARGAGGVYAKFRNLSPYEDVTLWWFKQGHEDVFFGYMKPQEEVSFQTYQGHQFYWRVESQKDKDSNALDPSHTFRIERKEYLYIFKDKHTTWQQLRKLEKERLVMKEYYEQTGRHWVAFWPRPTPHWPIRSDSAVVQSKHGYWNCYDPSHSLLNKACQEGSTRFNVELRLQSPRVFVVSNCLSKYEVYHLVDIAKNRELRPATVGNERSASVASTRVNSNAWVNANHTLITNTLYHRLADITMIDLSSDMKVAEALELNYATVGSHYDPHLEAGSRGVPEMRFLTVWLMLSAEELEGGNLAFGTHWTYDHVEGDCILLYNQLEDGNIDEFSVHENKRVRKGSKYYGKIQMWDPEMPHGFDPKTNKISRVKDEL